MKTKFFDQMDRKLYPILEKFRGQPFTEKLELSQVKLITVFPHSTIQKQSNDEIL